MKHRPTWAAVLLGLALLLPTATPPAALATPALLNPRLSNGTNSVEQLPGFQLTPDGSRALFLASIGVPNQLFSAPTDGSAPQIRLSEIENFSDTVTDFRITPDGSRVVYLYGQPFGQRELFSAPVDGSSAPVQLSGPLADSGAVVSFAISPDSSQVVYVADPVADQVFALFSVPITGAIEPLQLNKTPVAGGSVLGSLAITPDGSGVIYQADLDIDGTLELYHSLIDSTGSTRLNSALQPLGDISDFVLLPNGSQVLYLADQEVDERMELYRAPLPRPATAGGGVIVPPPGASTKLSGPLIAGASIDDYELSSDGAWVLYTADAEVLGQVDLYRVASSGGMPLRLNGPLVAGGSVRTFRISPNSRWVTYTADERSDELVELFAATMDGSSRPRLSGGLVAGGDVRPAHMITPDSLRVIYMADQEQDEVDELYSVRLPEGQAMAPGPPVPPARLNGLLVAGGDVQSFRVSPAGERVIYYADQEQDGRTELYSVPVADGQVTKLNGPLVDNGRVRAAELTPDGSRVIYLADQDEDDTFALYAAYEPAPAVSVSGPATPVGTGPTPLLVSLSTPIALSSVLVRLEVMGGDAVLGEDYSLPGGAGHVEIRFAPGETSKGVLIEVQANPARTTERIVKLGLADTLGVDLGTPSAITVTLAPRAPGEPDTPGEDSLLQVYLPLVTR